MKAKSLLVLTIIAASITAFQLKGDPKPILEIGTEAPMKDLKMKDVSGSMIALEDKMQDNGLLVIFSCNTCPFVIGTNDSDGWEGRYNDVANMAASANIGTILINSNEAKRDKGDSFDDMVKRSKDYRYKMSYVLDEKHVLADAFGARTTPHVFLFDKNYKLVYKGAIDDSNDSPDAVKEHWLMGAIEALAGGEKIDPNSTRQVGCSIKRVKS